MRIRVYPLLFNAEAGLSMPRDAGLHDMAVDFAKREMGEIPLFSQYMRTLVSCEIDENNQPVGVGGLMTLRMVPDIRDMRFLNSKHAKKLIDRAHEWLFDQGIMPGSDVFVRIASGDDPYRCQNYLEWLRLEKARPAERFVLPTR